MRWSRPEINKLVTELTMHMGNCNEKDIDAMKRLMKYCVDTPNRGWMILLKESGMVYIKNSFLKFEVYLTQATLHGKRPNKAYPESVCCLKVSS